MLTAEAHVETERPSRYLVQLCRHFTHQGRHLRHRRRHPHLGGDVRLRPGAPVRVEWSETHGIVNFGWGQCTMRADQGTLTLRAQANDAESLRRVQELVTGHLDRFSWRDRLSVNWQPPRAVSP
jgi:hypothetical protein